MSRAVLRLWLATRGPNGSDHAGWCIVGADPGDCRVTPEELLKAGQVEACLAEVEKQVRAAPADPKARVLLFQVLAIQGNWDRAINQLEVTGELDPENMLMAQVYRAVMLCEKFREDVWAGKRAPLVLGEPEEWIGMMVQAAALDGQGQHEAAASLRAKAFEAAPTSAGSIQVGADEATAASHAFEWISDADEALGPILEALVDGKYYWVPWHRIKLLRLDAPTDLRDTVWLPGQIVMTTGGEKVALVPARYPGSAAKSWDGAIRTGRRTEFVRDGGRERPIGQRMFATDAGEFALLDTRTVKIGDGA